MSKFILGKGNKSFLDIVKFESYPSSTIIDCKVKIINLFTKILDNKTVAVFGDYDLLILYSTVSREKKYIYKSKSINHIFCRIIPYEFMLNIDSIDNKNIETSAEFTSPPTCKCCKNFKKSNYSKSFFEIEILGELTVNTTLNEEIDSENNNKSFDLEDTKIQNTNNIKTIQVPVVIGEGSTQIFVVKEITVSPPGPPILRINDIEKEVILLDKKVIEGMVIINGSIILNINYETVVDISNETIKGSLYYCTTEIPFSGFINIIPKSGKKIKAGDTCIVLESYVDVDVDMDKDQWFNPLTTDYGKIVYQKIVENIIVNITVNITRNEYINIFVNN